MLPQAEARGQGLVEYALILVLVAVVVILLLGALGNSIGNVFSNILRYL
jgi:pilus assembly protein Flp/PilA